MELAVHEWNWNVLEITSSGYRRRLFQIYSFAEQISSN